MGTYFLLKKKIMKEKTPNLSEMYIPPPHQPLLNWSSP